MSGVGAVVTGDSAVVSSGVVTSGVVSAGVVSGVSGVVSPGVDALGVVSPGVVSDGAGLDSSGVEVAGASVVVFADVFMILSLFLFLQEDSEAAVSSTVSDSTAAAHTFNFIYWSPYCRSSGAYILSRRARFVKTAAARFILGLVLRSRMGQDSGALPCPELHQGGVLLGASPEPRLRTLFGKSALKNPAKTFKKGRGGDKVGGNRLLSGPAPNPA